MLGFALLLLVAGYALVRDGPSGWRGPVDDGKAPAWARVTTAGAATGLLTGFFGVGGGFVIVPALALVLGLPSRCSSLTGWWVSSRDGLPAPAHGSRWRWGISP